MYNISKKALAKIRKEFPTGAEVELISMHDPYNTNLCPGTRGVVRLVDDGGTIHIRWNSGDSLGVVYGIDKCKRISD